MLRLSALALGPLLASAAPKIGGGYVDHSTALHNWLLAQYSLASGTLLAALGRSVDRAWRSLEIALAGEKLLQSITDSEVDRALVEQVRQFLAIAIIPSLTPEFREKLSDEIRLARQAEIIPGPVPSADALATHVVRYLGTVTEATREADSWEFGEFAGELREHGFTALSELFEQPHGSELILAAVRYFFSREVLADLWHLRELRFARVDVRPDHIRVGFDRLADAFDRFTIVLKQLLDRVSTSQDSVAQPATTIRMERPKLPATPSPEPGFSIHGTHLVAPIRLNETGSRAAPCPVCFTAAVITTSASWVSLRCQSCGVEFEATDGTAPPPSPPTPSKAVDIPDSALPGVMAQNLKRWIDSKEPQHWVEHRKGSWSEEDFSILIYLVRFSRFWPMDQSEMKRVLIDLLRKYKAKNKSLETPASTPTRPAAPSATLPLPRGLIRTSDVYRTIDGNCWVPCPLCRSFNVEIPPRAIGVISLTCSGCGRMFAADLMKKPTSVTLPPPPPPPPSFWNTIRKWFGGD